MWFMLGGLKTYLTDYFFVVLLYVTVSGMVDLSSTFYSVFVVEIGKDLDCIRHNPDDKDYSCVCNISKNFQADLIKFSTKVVILVLLSFLEKRKYRWLNIFNGRPSLPVPVNLLDDHERRIVYMSAFGLTAFSVLHLLSGTHYFIITGLPSWASVYVSALNVLFVVALYYPIFAAVGSSNRLLGSILGVLYVTYGGTIYITEIILCRSSFGDPLGVISEDHISFWVSNIPWIVCCFITWIQFVVASVQEIFKLTIPKNQKLKADIPVKFTSCGVYVRWLLNKPRKRHTAWTKLSKESFENARNEGKLLHYKSVPGFRYSTRILGTFLVALILIYRFSLMEIPSLRKLSNDVHTQLNSLSFYMEESNYTNQFYMWKEIVYRIDAILYVSMGFSSLIVVGFIAHSLVTYRNHLLRMFRGDKSFLPENKSSPSSLLICCLKYSGYQIGFIFWAFIVFQITIAVGIVMVYYQIILPIKFKTDSVFIRQLDVIWPSCVFGGVVYILQLAWAKFFFLQDHGTILGLDNRRMFHVTSFVMFYFNIILGIISCMSRLFRGMVFGLIYLGRLDHSILQRGIELLDPGYRAYVGFLAVEEAHVHPVLVAFCRLLVETHHDRFLYERRDLQLSRMTSGRRTNKTARNRWLLAYTLIRNPSLIKVSLRRFDVGNKTSLDKSPTKTRTVPRVCYARPIIELPSVA
ncbi:stimulated by retinoic acid gene 6 protein-like [Saccoglossus kowalevskii]